MGCSAAKNVTVEPMDNPSKAAHMTNGTHEKLSSPRRVSDVPPLIGEEPQTELLEAGNVNNVHKGANGMSFDIAFEEEAGESIIRRHPPKRFQRLEDQEQTSPDVSLDRLKEKLNEAEQRRQQILQQRVQSAAIVRKVLKKQSSVDSSDANYLEVPNNNKQDTPLVTNSEPNSDNNVVTK